MDSDGGHTVAADQDRRKQETARSGTDSQLIKTPLKVNDDSTDNASAQPPVWKNQSVQNDSPSPPIKPVKRSTTLSVNKEAAIDKDRDARKAKAESKHLAKCDRLEQTAQGSNMPERFRREKQDKLDDEYKRKLDKIDKKYHKNLEKAERKVEKDQAKQDKRDSKSSSSSSLNSPQTSSAPSTTLTAHKEPKKNKVKSFFKDIPSSTGDTYSGSSGFGHTRSSIDGTHSGRHISSSFNPGVGGGAILPMMAAGGATSGCDGRGGCAGTGGC